ncbi:MAG: type II secretion system F family protein [Candidatus Omnitrophica bacterium]|nr:type II secretion system F family protein [Candidatus Omnitrophota bacterium]
MPLFNYKAKSAPNELKTGTIEAESQSNAASRLQEMGLYPLSIEEAEGRPRGRILRRRKISRRDVTVFTRQLHNLLASGLTILSGLKILRDQSENKDMQRLIGRLIDDLKEGEHFSQALSKHPQAFSTLYCSIVASGEAGGFIDEALERVAGFLEKDQAVRSKIISSLIYPALIAIVGSITVFVLLTFVIPKFVSMFEEFGETLPLPTAILISISAFFNSYYWLIALLAAIAVFIFKRIYGSDEGRLAIDSFKLRAPFFGNFNTKASIADFTRTLSALTGGGVSILSALEIAQNSAGNALLKQEIAAFREKIREGGKLSSCIAASAHFPTYVSNIVAVGEETGTMDKSLERIARTYEDEVDQVTKAMLTGLEPAMILIMGSVVGFIVIAMLLPIFQINFMAQ